MLGPAEPWGKYPQVWPGPTGPLSSNPLAEIESPVVQYVGVGTITTLRYWGLPVGQIPTVEARPWETEQHTWGITRHGRVAAVDDFERFVDPASAVERVRRFDVQRCTSAAAEDIVPEGRAWEICRLFVPVAAIGIIERIVTTWRVTALDANGDPLFTYADNGQDPCVQRLVHPDPLVGTLEWQFRLVRVARPFYNGAPIVPYVDAGTVDSVRGDDVIPPWDDLRYGAAAQWGDEQDIIVQPSSYLRVWVILVGPTEAFRVDRLGARLGGYTQRGGRRGAALQSVLSRWS